MRVSDPDAREPLKVYVLVISLPFSAYMYAEGFYRMDERAWVEGHVRAFADFGGTTPLIAPDNLKTGVAKNTIDQLIVNEQYRRMLEHYGCAAVPTRVRKPRDKGGVEGAVLIVEREAIAALRNRTFLSLGELNRALRERVDAINARPFQKRAGSRNEVLLGQERPCLQPLPPAPYEMVERGTATVQFNYHSKCVATHLTWNGQLQQMRSWPDHPQVARYLRVRQLRISLRGQGLKPAQDSI